MHDEERLSSQNQRKEIGEKTRERRRIMTKSIPISSRPPLSRPPRIKSTGKGGNFANEKSAIETFGPISLISQTCASLWAAGRDGGHSTPDKYNPPFQ